LVTRRGPVLDFTTKHGSPPSIPFPPFYRFQEDIFTAFFQKLEAFNPPPLATNTVGPPQLPPPKKQKNTLGEPRKPAQPPPFSECIRILNKWTPGYLDLFLPGFQKSLSRVVQKVPPSPIFKAQGYPFSRVSRNVGRFFFWNCVQFDRPLSRRRVPFVACFHAFKDTDPLPYSTSASALQPSLFAPPRNFGHPSFSKPQKPNPSSRFNSPSPPCRLVFSSLDSFLVRAVPLLPLPLEFFFHVSPR